MLRNAMLGIIAGLSCRIRHPGFGRRWRRARFELRFDSIRGEFDPG